MAKRTLELQPGETLIGSEVVAMHRRILIGIKMDTGRLYITDQRIAFPDGVDSFSYPLDEIQCFQNGMLGATTLAMKNGKMHKFTTSSAKKVKAWLREAGISEQ